MAIKVSAAELPSSVIQAKTATNSGVRRSKEAVHSGIGADDLLGLQHILDESTG